ncbi:MAG: S46 family peptidase [Crocinitomicaceae bacterium]|nr:S46 family peptidase [Crocinitomicaceae bacterium]
MKSTLNILLFILILNPIVRADEGMIIPSLIAAFESDMKAKGMKLSAKDIYDINNSSMKDAILHFGGGCTSELVSEKGLLLTNHHCGYSQIQSHSSLENNYIKNGYWAKNLSEELPNPGLTATRIVRIEDVTLQVLEVLNNSDYSPKEKDSIRKAVIKRLIETATKETHYEAKIKAFNFGNNYYMIVKEVFKDVRFVGTPPNSIGKFGGDTDNWVWPRHTGDFSVFRVYASKDNKPADYSTENIPYKPLHFLPISFKNRKEGDFTMVYGFPGRTEQHVVSSYLKFIIEKERPSRIRMRDLSLDVINTEMKNSELVKIQYASKQARISNAWKKWIGQIDGLKRMNAVDVKKAQESAYTKKANSNPKWNNYKNVVKEMNSLVEKEVINEFNYSMAIEYFYVGPEFFKLIRSLDSYIENSKKNGEKNKDSQNEEIKKLEQTANAHFKNYNCSIDKGIFRKQFEEYVKQVTNSEGNLEIDFDASTNEIFSKSIFTSKKRFLSFIGQLQKKGPKKLKKDPGYIHYKSYYKIFLETVYPSYQLFKVKMDQLLKTYVKGKYEMFPDKNHWPDANSTMRISYGQLEGSRPADGMKYTEHTTLDGIIAKYNSGNPDFALLPRMLELHKNKEYGDYAQDGSLWVCFTGSNHTTGGNSGSPVIDAQGGLMGLNFDRSWESTMSDFMFNPNRCRNIVVDIRYVLWVMDIYSGASHLVDEMKLIRN